MNHTTKEQLVLDRTIGVLYPSSLDCLGGHKGPKELTFYEEYDDDRSYLMIVQRCGHCHLPTGYETYANNDNTERFYAGKDPVAQND